MWAQQALVYISYRSFYIPIKLQASEESVLSVEPGMLSSETVPGAHARHFLAALQATGTVLQIYIFLRLSIADMCICRSKSSTLKHPITGCGSTVLSKSLNITGDQPLGGLSSKSPLNYGFYHA